MQLKYLKIYKLLATFATNLFAAFISLIVYEYTNSIFLALTVLFAQKTLTVIFNLVFKKLMTKHPQLFLLFRLIPIFLYGISTILISVNILISIIGISIFSALSVSFDSIPSEIIFNYSSTNATKTGKNYAFTKVFELMGFVLAEFLGGIILTFLTETILICIGLIIYCIAIIPLFMYYIKNKNNFNFNKELISNAFQPHKKKENSHNGKVIKHLKINYFIKWAIIGALDFSFYFLALFIFINHRNYMLIGIVSVFYDLSYMLAHFLFAKLYEKRDVNKICIILFIVFAVSIFLFVILIKNYYIIILLFAIIGFCTPFFVDFLSNRMLLKSRIVGISNDLIINKLNGTASGEQIISLFGMTFGIIPMIIFTGALSLFSIYYIPSREEKSRKMLVDYLHNNNKE